MPHLALFLIVAMLGVLTPSAAGAQVEQGATLTILRGQVAVLHANGSAVQPAPDGSTVNVGDEIRTISRSGALITFFTGTEIEMGEETILIVEQLSRRGDTINISLRQALGATVNRVQSLAGTGSTYQIQAGGAVALVRGTTFAMVGPVTTPVGDVVTIACREDCSAASTFNGCAMAPFSGLGVTTSGGKADSGCQSFSVDRAESLFDAAAQGVTTVEQTVQGDTRGVPAGQVAAGGRQETDARIDQQQQEAQQKDQKPALTTDPPSDPPRLPTPQSLPASGASPTPALPHAPPEVPTPPPPPPQPCNTVTRSGGFGATQTNHEIGNTSGTFSFSYEAFNIPDRFQVLYEGGTLLDTGFVPAPYPRPPGVPPTTPGTATVNLTYSGSATFITVIVTGSEPGTAWDYEVGCPT